MSGTHLTVETDGGAVGVQERLVAPVTDLPSPGPSDGRRRRGATRSHRPFWRRHRRVGQVLLAVAVVLLLALGIVGWSVGRALTAPGTDSVAARLAEWGRDHGASSLIDAAERWRYRQHPPRTGGALAGGIPDPAGAGAAANPARRNVAVRPLSPVPPVVSPGLPDEGRWRTLATVGGRPALQAAYLRPDATHTSYLAGVAWIDPKLLRFVLHPGTQEPGHGPWQLAPSLPTDRTGLTAAFNSGFRLAEAQGGYYADGRTVGTLRAGSAALVINQDGSATVGQWGRDVSMTPSVAAVRQNLALLVDGGHVVDGIDGNAGHRWGATLGNKLYVARSGVGVTAAGALVYASGNSLSAGTLADLLARAGCVRAMELDINPDWTSFSYYEPIGGTAQKLLANMQRPANRYQTTSTRDFVAVYAR